MAFQFEEKPQSRNGTTGPQGSETREYYAVGTVDADYVKAAAKSLTPTSIATESGLLYRQAIEISSGGGDYWNVSVPYSPQSKESGSYTISFDTAGGTVCMKASYEVIGAYDETGAIAAPDNNSIDLDDEGVPQGTEVIIPSLKLTVAFRHPAATINEGVIRTLARNTGKVNSDTFLGFDPGEVLFIGATGSESESEAEVSYQFACSENVVNLVVGGITIDSKDGWDYASVRFKKAAADKPSTIPQSITIHRVYRRTALAPIVGFGGA